MFQVRCTGQEGCRSALRWRDEFTPSYRVYKNGGVVLVRGWWVQDTWKLSDKKKVGELGFDAKPDRSGQEQNARAEGLVDGLSSRCFEDMQKKLKKNKKSDALLHGRQRKRPGVHAGRSSCVVKGSETSRVSSMPIPSSRGSMVVHRGRRERNRFPVNLASAIRCSTPTSRPTVSCSPDQVRLFQRVHCSFHGNYFHSHILIDDRQLHDSHFTDCLTSLLIRKKQYLLLKGVMLKDDRTALFWELPTCVSACMLIRAIDFSCHTKKSGRHIQVCCCCHWRG